MRNLLRAARIALARQLVHAALALLSLAAAGARGEPLPLWEAGAGVAASDFSYVRQVGWVFQPHLNFDNHDVLGYTGWNLGLLGGPVFSDRRYNRYFYGVGPAFATATRPAYAAAGGYGGTQVIAALSTRYREYWIGGFMRWDALDHAALEDSPLVRSRQSFSVGFAIAWILGESTTQVESVR